MTKYRVIYYSSTNRFHIEKESWFWWSELKVPYNGAYKSSFVFENEAKNNLLRYLNPPEEVKPTTRVVFEVEVD